MIADTTIKRPALRYYGGKWNLAPWIISYFPPHKNYVEPCGGAASVLLQKPRSPLETYNDLDGNVVNFFRVLRDNQDELIRKIRLTPWAREELDTARAADPDPVESARRFFVSSWQSISCMSHELSTGWRSVSFSDQSFNAAPHNYFDMIDAGLLETVARRFYGVQIENSPYEYLLERFDRKDTLFFFDPPYVQDTRTNKKSYFFEWGDKDHSGAADILRTRTGFVIVSGYACPLYAELYEAHGWQRVDRMSQTNSGGKRVESLWLNPRTVEAQAQKTLF